MFNSSPATSAMIQNEIPHVGYIFPCSIPRIGGYRAILTTAKTAVHGFILSSAIFDAPLFWVEEMDAQETSLTVASIVSTWNETIHSQCSSTDQENCQECKGFYVAQWDTVTEAFLRYWRSWEVRSCSNSANGGRKRVHLRVPTPYPQGVDLTKY